MGRSVPVVAAAGGHSLLVGVGTSCYYIECEEFEGLSCSGIGLLVLRSLQRVQCQLQGRLRIIRYPTLSSSVGSS